MWNSVAENLKITEENMLPLQRHLQIVRCSSLLGYDAKSLIHSPARYRAHTLIFADCTVVLLKCSEILALLDLLYNPMVNEVFTSLQVEVFSSYIGAKGRTRPTGRNTPWRDQV